MTSRPDLQRCLLKGCNEKALYDLAYCSFHHAGEAVKRGEASACVQCGLFAKTPGFPTCSRLCGSKLAGSRQSSGSTGYQPRPYSGTSSTPSTITDPKVPKREYDGKYSWEYACGCTVRTRVATRPTLCPICRPSASTGRVQPDSLTPSVSDPAAPSNADPFRDVADSALARVDPRHQRAGGFRPDRPRITKDTTQKDMDFLTGSDDEADYATPSEAAQPESPVIETTSSSDSAVLVDHRGVSRSNTMMTAPPAYEDDVGWTKVDVPSGSSSPSKAPTLSPPVPQKEPPKVPPRRRGLAGQTITSSRAPGVSANADPESVSSPSAGSGGAPEPIVTRSGSLGRPQHSKHPALSPSGTSQPNASPVPLFPSAPTNALGISETGDAPKKPLVIADHGVGEQSDGFSNQDPFPIEYKKKKYPSVEHLFHAMKFMETRPLLAEHIRECEDPKGEADRFRFEQNPGWEQMQLQKMEEVIQLKCKQHSVFRDSLRNTGDTHIWFNDPDPFWGTGADGKGENQFGEVLMRARDSLPKSRLSRK